MAGSIRPRLASAVSKLKEHGDHDEAAAVAALLGPRGYLLLQRTETGDTEALSITVSDELKKVIQEELEEFDLVLDSLADEAYRMVRDEGWVPPKVAKYGRNQRGGTNVVLQTRVDASLRRQVREMLPALAERCGYRVTEASIVLSHVCEELGIDRTQAVEREPVSTQVPEPVREFWKAEAERRGVELRDVAADGLRAMLDGSWSPDWAGFRARRPKGDLVVVKVRVDKTLVAGLRNRQGVLSEAAGFTVGQDFALWTVFADRLGLPDA